MSKNYAIMRIEKIHDMGSLQRRYEHNFREAIVLNADIDHSQNEELVDQTGMDYKALWYERMHQVSLEKGAPVKRRKNSVIAYEVMMTFSSNDSLDLEAWKKENVEWLQTQFGKDNVLSVQCHMDEQVPHLHAIVIPIDERGKLCAVSYTGTRAKMFQMQDSYGKAMERVGLSRGEMYSVAKRQHVSKFYRKINDVVEMDIPYPLPEESMQDYRNRLNEFIQGREFQYLGEKEQLQKTITESKTQLAQVKAKYSEAIKLEDDLLLNFDGNYKAVKKRLQLYRDIEKSVPRKTLNATLLALLQRFPLLENIRNHKKQKKTSLEQGQEDMGFLE